MHGETVKLTLLLSYTNQSVNAV